MGSPGEDLSGFQEGTLHFEIKGSTRAPFELGFQSGLFSRGDQTNNFVRFGPGEAYRLEADWVKHGIPVKELDQGARFDDVTSMLYLRADEQTDGGDIYLKNISYTAK
jgi:hypothetical protein